MKKIVLVLKGLLIGIGKIIPGVSGGLIAISLNLYDKCIKAINNLFKKTKESLLLLIPVGIGIILGISLFSKIIIYCLNSYYLCTMLLFIGLIIGGIPSIIKKAKDEYKNKNNLFILLLIIVGIIFLTINPIYIKLYENNFFTIFILGFLDACSTVIPGISGTAIFMMIGKYDFVMNTFSNLTNISLLLENFKVMFPFVLGIIIGVIILVKLINYLFEKHETKTYFYISLFSIFSVISLFITTLKKSYSIWEIIIGVILLFIGYKIGKKIDQIS